MNDRLEPRIRILLGSSIAIGPGKAALLAAIGDTGSIAAAGRRMGMSYRRAWVLTKTMNACFREPLIEAAKGGIGGGGARLTAAASGSLLRSVAAGKRHFRGLYLPKVTVLGHIPGS